MLSQTFARIAILGPGGMGKTSLAKAALHNPDILAKYQHRFFVSCESAIDNLGIAAAIGAHLGLKPGKNLIQPVIRDLTAKPPCLLILDNLETAWEPLLTRDNVEDLLGLIAQIEHVSLLITMRGTERPGNVLWTRPFLPPLEPLSTDAAHEMFLEIADNIHDPAEVTQLLTLTDNLPLASGPSIIGRGNHRTASLDASITVSLMSPRIVSVPGAKDLLSLLSILPDGLSDIELAQSQLPIQDVLACKAVLVRTSLAYQDNKHRLKCLVPIREYMQFYHPVASSLSTPLGMYFYRLLKVYTKYRGFNHAATSIDQITTNLGNLHPVLVRGLEPQNPHLADTIQSTIALNHFLRYTGRGISTLLDQATAALRKVELPMIEVELTIELLHSAAYKPVDDAEGKITGACSRCQEFDEPQVESQLNLAIGMYHSQSDASKSRPYLKKALVLAKSVGDLQQQSRITLVMADSMWQAGQYDQGKPIAYEAYRLAVTSSNLFDEARALDMRAAYLVSMGNYKGCAVILQRARDLLALCGMSKGDVYHKNLSLEAEIHLMKSEYSEARALYEQILQVSLSAQDFYNHAYSLLNLAWVGAETHESLHDVHLTLDKTLALFEGVKQIDTFGVNACRTIIGELELREGDLKSARATLEACLKYAWVANAEISAYCLERLGDTRRWGASHFGWSSTYAVIFLVLTKKLGEKAAHEQGTEMPRRCISSPTEMIPLRKACSM
ncbi:hypothetical protein FB45DRAFT_836537 [Roridomyces roridus]|uniref:Uncharacterized protein n=1 Tax=Roridomyces roridus TaxID=1738132 RepID=A0AAD7BLR2_9AGAR|nr:hypothetical protein FB45DRAFT_836537 [Roridomyces roridus]